MGARGVASLFRKKSNSSKSGLSIFFRKDFLFQIANILFSLKHV